MDPFSLGPLAALLDPVLLLRVFYLAAAALVSPAFSA
jgi:hypothetical protein